MGSLLLPSAGQSTEEDVDGLLRLLEVVVVAVLLLALLIMRVRWLRHLLECVPELVALFGGVVAVWMPRALFLQQVLESARVLLRVPFRRALDSRDSIVWLALAVGTRVVVVVAAAALVRIAAAAAALVLLGLATNGVVLGIGLVFFIRLGRDHVLEVGDGPGAATTEVFEGAAVIEAVLEEVDDHLVGDVDDGGVLVEKAAHVLAEGLALFLLDHGQVHASTRSAHGAREVDCELLLQLVPLVDRVLVQRLEPCEWCLVQAEGEVEALGVAVAASVLDGEGVASEALDGILLHVVLGDPQRLEFVGEEQVAKSR
jgi:hypothetical protein